MEQLKWTEDIGDHKNNKKKTVEETEETGGVEGKEELNSTVLIPL